MFIILLCYTGLVAVCVCYARMVCTIRKYHCGTHFGVTASTNDELSQAPTISRASVVEKSGMGANCDKNATVKRVAEKMSAESK